MEEFLTPFLKIVVIAALNLFFSVFAELSLSQELLQKENEQLSDELPTHRKGDGELSSCYELLEQKYLQLEETSAKQPEESASAAATSVTEALALVEIDKCDGWSDDTPQIPDLVEGFTKLLN